MTSLVPLLLLVLQAHVQWAQLGQADSCPDQTAETPPLRQPCVSLHQSFHLECIWPWAVDPQVRMCPTGHSWLCWQVWHMRGWHTTHLTEHQGNPERVSVPSGWPPGSLCPVTWGQDVSRLSWVLSPAAETSRSFAALIPSVWLTLWWAGEPEDPAESELQSALLCFFPSYKRSCWQFSYTEECCHPCHVPSESDIRKRSFHLQVFNKMYGQTHTH